MKWRQSIATGVHGGAAFFVVLTFCLLYVPVETKLMENKTPTKTRDDAICHLCTCGYAEDNETVVSLNCYYRNLTEIPVGIPKSVTQLNMSGNTQLSLTGRSFQNAPRKLSVLDLSNCTLQTASINSSIFADINALEYLDLAFNNLSLFYKAKEPTHLLSNLTNLKTLKIDNDLDNSENRSYPGNALVDLITLTKLWMDGLPISLGHEFTSMDNLKTLRLSGLNCNIPLLNNDLIGNVSNVTILEIIACKVRNISRDAFISFKKLEILDISCNFDLGFDNLFPALPSLRESKIHTLRANRLYSSFSIGQMIKTDHLKMIQNLSLKAIELESNCLESVQYGAIDYLPKTLKHLYLRGNEFKLGLYLLEAEELVSLETMDLSYQFFPYVRKKKRSARNHCKLPDLHSKQIDLPKNLMSGNFGHSRLAFSIKQVNFSKNQVTNFSSPSSMLVEWIGPIYGLEKMEYVDMSDNGCRKVDLGFFENTPNLVTLNISKNLFNNDIEGDHDGRLFAKLSNLQHLNMVDLRLKELPYKVFKNLHSLIHLDLSENILNEFNIDLRNLKRLRVLDLSFNQLTTLTESTMEHIENIALDAHRKEERVQIFLQGNRFQCTCPNLQALEWAADTPFVDVKLHHCQFENKSIANFTDSKSLERIIEELDKSCASYWFLILALACILAMIITFIGSAIAYRFRWRLRYWYYVKGKRFIRTRKGYTQLSTDARFQFDALIVNCIEDQEFVSNTLVDRLETEERMKLYIIERNMLGNQDVISTLANAANVSGVTFLIVTEQATKDGDWWCGLRMAQEESYRRKKKSYYAIYPNAIPFDAVETHMELAQLFRDPDNFIMYPNAEDDDAMSVFWAKCIHIIKQADSGESIELQNV